MNGYMVLSMTQILKLMDKAIQSSKQTYDGHIVQQACIVLSIAIDESKQFRSGGAMHCDIDNII